MSFFPCTLSSTGHTEDVDEVNYLRCDDLDDLQGVDPWAPVPPTPPTAAQRLAARQLRVGRAMIETDADFLALVSPDLYLVRGSVVHAFMRGVSQTAAYQAVPGARNALRHTLHQTGVL